MLPLWRYWLSSRVNKGLMYCKFGAAKSYFFFNVKWNFLWNVSAFQLGLIQPAGLVGSYPSRTRDMNHREESVISKPFIMLLNSFCFLMVAKVTVGAIRHSSGGQATAAVGGLLPCGCCRLPNKSMWKEGWGHGMWVKNKIAEHGHTSINSQIESHCPLTQAMFWSPIYSTTMPLSLWALSSVLDKLYLFCY